MVQEPSYIASHCIPEAGPYIPEAEPHIPLLKLKYLRLENAFSPKNSVLGGFQHGLQNCYLSLKPHVKGEQFPLREKVIACSSADNMLFFLFFTMII